MKRALLMVPLVSVTAAGRVSASPSVVEMWAEDRARMDVLVLATGSRGSAAERSEVWPPSRGELGEPELEDALEAALDWRAEVDPRRVDPSIEEAARACGGHLSCVMRPLLPHDGSIEERRAGFALLLSTLSVPEGTRVTALLLDLERASDAARGAGQEAPGREEERILEDASDSGSRVVARGADLEDALGEIADQELRPRFEARGAWKARGAIEVVLPPDSEVLLDGRIIGVSPGGHTRIRGVTPGPHRVSFRLTGDLDEVASAAVEVPGGAAVAATLVPLERRSVSLRASVAFFGGLAVGMLGLPVFFTDTSRPAGIGMMAGGGLLVGSGLFLDGDPIAIAVSIGLGLATGAALIAVY